MTTRRRSLVHTTAIACALSCLFSCERGGQSGDDGQMVEQPHGPDGGVQGDAGSAMDDDAGAPEFVATCCIVLDGDSQLVCAAGITRTAEEDAISAALDATFHCTGSEGAWSCSCDGTELYSLAAGCIGALKEACNKDAEPIRGRPAEPPPGNCETTIESRAGRCEQSAEGDYTCRCAGAAASRQQHADTCEAALWAACATGCNDSNGSCGVDTSAKVGAYACDCPQYAGILRGASATTCAGALQSACSVNYVSDLGCNAYSGFCDRVDDEFRCTCLASADANIPVTEVANRWLPCEAALDAACGTGGAPPGKQCLGDANGYQARCVQAPADDAPFTCSCVFHDASGESPYDAQNVSDTNCEAALVSVCPQLVPLDSDARERACDYYDRCDTQYVGFDPDECKASAPDACVACTNTELDRLEQAKDANGCPTQRAGCAQPCAELVAKPTAVAKCEADLDAAALLTDEAKCLCDRCWPAFGECIADTGCLEMLDCVTAQGCEGDACASDPVCGPIITRYQSTHSLGVLLRLGECPEKDACGM